MMNPANPLNLPAELPIARYRFSFLLNENLCLPPYAGSTLRGVFGHALRKAACMTRQKECGGCSLLQTCPYSRIFATPSSSLLNKSQHKNPPATLHHRSIFRRHPIPSRRQPLPIRYRIDRSGQATASAHCLCLRSSLQARHNKKQHDGHIGRHSCREQRLLAIRLPQ